MAERTISIYPIPKGITLEKIQQSFLEYTIQKIGLIAEKSTAYLQFAKASEIQALGTKYPQCKIPTLNDAQIGFVQPQFKWPVNKTTAKAEALVLIKKCDKIFQTSQDKIRQIFKIYAVERIVKFENTKEIVLQFSNQDQLQLLEMNFDDLKVPQLGPNAEIDVENQFPVERFIQKYLELNQVRTVQNQQKKEIVKPSASPVKEKIEEISSARQSQEKRIENYVKSKEEEKKKKEQELKRKLEDMERDIIQQEKVRQLANQKKRKEQEQKERVEKEKRQKQRAEKERKQRQARELKQRQQRQIKQKEQRQNKLREQKQRKQKEQIQKKQKELRENKLKEEEQQKRKQKEYNQKKEREQAQEAKSKYEIQRYQQQRQRNQENIKSNEVQLKKIQQQAQAQQLQKKQKERRQEERLIAEKAKRELQKQEKKIVKQQLPEKVQEERQLEQILAKEKQIRNKKQINLPQIIKTNSKQFKIKEANTSQTKEQHKSPYRVKQPLSIGNYKDISTHFITLVVVAWVYYLWISGK